MDNSIFESPRGLKLKLGVVIVCLIVLVPNIAFCQQDDQPGLPEQGPGLPGFVPDVLPQDDGSGTESLIPSGTLTPSGTLVPSGTSIFSPYQSLINQPYSTDYAEPREFLPAGTQDLFPGLLPVAEAGETTPPVLLASPIRQSLARTFEGAQPGSAAGSYNLKLGDAKFLLGLGLGIEGNDNIFTSETNRQSDIILLPTLQLASALKLADLNAIQFNLGLGYEAYLRHPDQDVMTLSPGSQIALTLYTGDFRIQLHDQFSLEQDPVSQPGLNNVANAGVFTNDIGGLVTWDLNKMVLTLGYDHTNTIATQSSASYPNQTNDAISQAAAFTINSSVKTGIESAVNFTNYSQDSSSQLANSQYQGSSQITLGPFLEWRLTDSTSLRADGGYEGFFVNQGTGQDTVSSDPLDWYGDLILSQSINARISHSLSIGREASGGLASSFEQIDYLRHSVAWNIVDKVGIGTVLYLEKANLDGGGTGQEQTTLYGASISVGWRLGSKLTVSTQYQFIRQDSPQAGSSFSQNELLLDFNYQF